MKKDAHTLNEQLFQATQRGEREAALKLLREGADINARDAQGRTPVMIATYQHHTEMVRALLQAGADVNIRDNHQENPLLHANVDLPKLNVSCYKRARIKKCSLATL